MLTADHLPHRTTLSTLVVQSTSATPKLPVDVLTPHNQSSCSSECAISSCVRSVSVSQIPVRYTPCTTAAGKCCSFCSCSVSWRSSLWPRSSASQWAISNVNPAVASCTACPDMVFITRRSHTVGQHWLRLRRPVASVVALLDPGVGIRADSICPCGVQSLAALRE